MLRISSQAQERLVFQEGLCCLQLVILGEEPFDLEVDNN
jgi:hypothetical protein